MSRRLLLADAGLAVLAVLAGALVGACIAAPGGEAVGTHRAPDTRSGMTANAREVRVPH